ncbi:MAG: cytochrome c oxidase subunit II [Gallionellales bacterium RIFCSPLOWO2_02_FULL_59_110]|nr:MAG: cytochrome c oxidase subunit II [Gallionellales bacterium RIFCSPLOWO2_02_FULL_59_110]
MKKQLPLWFWIAFFLFVSEPAHAKSIWDFQEPVTPVARTSLAASVEFMRIIMGIYIAVFAVFAYSIFKHRKSSGAQPGTFTGPGSRRQWILAITPFLLLIYIDYIWMGIPAFHAISRMEDTRTAADMTVKVTASQWKWQYEYPDEGISFVSAMATSQGQIHGREAKGEHYLLEVDNPLILPTNKKVRILLISTDVIHSWWVPSFGVKRDAVPGYLREMWVNIEKPGIYRGQCAQLCGDGHSFMPIVVEAVAEPQFNEWVAQKKAQSSQAEAVAGKAWSREELMAKGDEVYKVVCSACHQADGKGLPGAFPALSGSSIVNGPMLDKEGHLFKDGHLDRVMNGKPGTAMQAFKNSLSDAEIAAVVTYERNSFGNRMGDMVQPAQVKALR